MVKPALPSWLRSVPVAAAASYSSSIMDGVRRPAVLGACNRCPMRKPRWLLECFYQRKAPLAHAAAHGSGIGTGYVRNKMHCRSWEGWRMVVND